MPPSEQTVDPLDPFGQWQAVRDRTMEIWSKAMLDFVHSDAYASASAKWLDTYLNMSTPFQRAIDQALGQTMTQYKIPSTDDISRLAERLWNVELKLDDLDARFDQIVGLLKELAARPAAPAPAGAKPRPARAPRKKAPAPPKATKETAQAESGAQESAPPTEAVSQGKKSTNGATGAKRARVARSAEAKPRAGTRRSAAEKPAAEPAPAEKQEQA